MKITLQSMDMGSPNTVERYHQLYLCVHGMYVEAILLLDLWSCWTHITGYIATCVSSCACVNLSSSLLQCIEYKQQKCVV